MAKTSVILSIVLDVSRLFLAIYSVYVKIMMDSSPEYKAQCDLSEYVSCSKTFNSKYGRGFGLLGDILGEDHPLNMPNGIYGSVFYFIHLILVLFVRTPTGMRIRLVNSIALTIGCGWLAYTLLFVIKHMCIVCIPMYFLNVVTLASDAWQLRCATACGKAAVTKAEARKKKK